MSVTLKLKPTCENTYLWSNPAGSSPKRPVEALAAGVVHAGRAPAVAAPFAERADGPQPGRVVGHDRPALAGGHVVSGVERERRGLAEAAHRLPVVGGAERVAAVLDQHQVVLAAELGHALHVERVAEAVRHEDRPGAVADGGGDASQRGLKVSSSTSTYTGTSPYW